MNFLPLPLCIYPSKKKKRVRPNKTFIIPGKLFDVFDVKRLKEGREMKREEKEDERRGRRMYISGWMMVKGGEMAELEKAEDRNQEQRWWRT